MEYYGARYYDPAKASQFISPDPIISDIYNPQSLNRYSYVLNGPYKYVDPSGNVVWPIVIQQITHIITVAVIAAVVNLAVTVTIESIEQYQETGKVDTTKALEDSLPSGVGGFVSGIGSGVSSATNVDPTVGVFIEQGSEGLGEITKNEIGKAINEFGKNNPIPEEVNPINPNPKDKSSQIYKSRDISSEDGVYKNIVHNLIGNRRINSDKLIEDYRASPHSVPFEEFVIKNYHKYVIG